MNKQIHNVETGEVTVVALTDDEIALVQQLQADLELKTQAKEATKAKLIALGLTADDLEVLGLGG